MAGKRHLLPAAGLVLLDVVCGAGAALAQSAIEEIPFDQKLVAAAPAPDRFGATLAVAGDTLVVGASTANVGGKFFVGAADLFEREGASGAWGAPRRLVAADGAAFDQLGGAGVAVAGDEVFLGVPLARVDGVLQQGAVYVFARDAGGADTWGQAAKLTDPSVGVIGHFGSSIALDGDRMAIGASRGGGGNGQVTVFERDRGGPGVWGIAGAVLDSASGDGGLPLEGFGGAVALEGDLLVVGASSADVSFFREDDGAAYVFRRSPIIPDQWDFVSRLIDPAAAVCPGALTLAEVSLQSEDVQAEVERCALEEGRTDRDGFGSAVAIAGDTIVVGSPGAEATTGGPAGAVFVFRRDPAGADAWSLAARLEASDVAASSTAGFGRVLAFDGEAILVGAAGSEVGPDTDQGAVYRFERNEGGPDAWGEAGRIVAGDGLARESFGSAVAFDGAEAIVGASGYELGQGAVYLSAAVPEPGPAFEATGELVGGGIVEGPDGVLLGALGSEPAAPLPVWIASVTAPDAPALAPMQAVGGFYNVGAVETASAEVDAPFALALPITEGTDTTHLVAAVLDPPDLVGEVGPPGWFPVQGMVNAEAGLFSITLPALFRQGSIVVLATHPELGALEPPAPSEPPAPLPRDPSGPELLPDFDIICKDYADPSQCAEADRVRMNGLLKAAHDDFVSFGFGKPRLMVSTSTVEVTEGGKTFQKVESARFLNIFATEPARCAPAVLGFYDARNWAVTLCYGGSGTPEDKLAATVRHEMFHAFQHGFGNFHKDWGTASKLNLADLERIQWEREGTAAASEESGHEMHRNKVDVPPLHSIDRALTAASTSAGDFIEYSAQDFWVHLGHRLGPQAFGISYLAELFVRGLSPEAADAMLGEAHGSSLGDEYFAWVKNQGIERKDDLDGALIDPCNLELPRDSPVVGTPRELLFPALDSPPSVTGTLQRLSAGMVRVTVTQDQGPTVVTASSTDPDLKFKVYLDGDLACADGADGERRFEALARNQVLVVLVANTSHTAGDRLQFTVSLGPGA